MRIRTTHLGISLLACFTLFTSAPGFVTPAHAQTYYLYSLQQPDGSKGPPLPDDPYAGAEPIITLDAVRQIYQVQDNTNAYALLLEAHQLDAMSATTSTMSADSIDPTGGTGDTNSTGGDYTNNFQPLVFGPNDLVIEGQFDLVNGWAYLTLSNSQPEEHYQLLYTNLLNGDAQAWTLGEIITGADNTNMTPFDPLFIDTTNSQLFFRAHHSDAVAYVEPGQNAVEPNPATGDPGQPGKFFILSYYNLSNDLTVHYQLSGVAQSGVDYSNVSGVTTIPADAGLVEIDVTPLNDNQVDGAEPLTLTILQTNSHLILPQNSSATIFVEDSSTTVSVTRNGDAGAIEPDGPPGEPAQAGSFVFTRSDERNLYPPLTVYYTLSGTATNGVDYAFLSGSVDFADQDPQAFLDVNPLANPNFDDTKTVTLTLVATNTYLTNAPIQDTVNIFDSSTTVSIQTTANSVNGGQGIFELDRSDTRGDTDIPLTVYFQISGTASNGVDYETITSPITFAAGATSTNIYVNIIQGDDIQSNETVTLTLITNDNAYYINPIESNATVTIAPTYGFIWVSTNNLPVGDDYYAPSNSLIISEEGGSNFVMISTNISTVNGGALVTNIVETNWSGISGLPDEVYFVAPQMPVNAFTNSAGFTNGDMFFGSGPSIGWLSAGAVRSNLQWCVLTNSTVVNALPLRGGICADQTGTFSNQLIAVTSDGTLGGNPGLKGVWRIDSHAHPTLIAQINTLHLEGVTTLTNDVQKWGPWAGKIITGDEIEYQIYAVSANGTVTSNDTRNLISRGIRPEDFKVIPPNQSLYITTGFNLLELPPQYFTNHIGDLLIADAGEYDSPGLFVVHWNGTAFVTTQIPLPFGAEHVAFAPIILP